MHAHDTTQAFHAREIQTLGALASSARSWGAFSLVFGTIGIVVVVPAMGFFGSSTRAELLLAVAAFALIGLLAGMSYVKAARQLHDVRTSPSQGPELAVRGLDALGRAFRLEAIVTGMSISLAFAAGLVFFALRSI